MKNFASNYYSIQKISFASGAPRYVLDEDGYLFSGGIYRTKIKPEDLPAWYIHGRYYRCFGYLSTKNIAKLVYQPCRFTNHFLKDDCLFVTYTTHVPTSEIDHDERIFGNTILPFLAGARIYSSYDIDPLIAKIKDKATWLKTKFPEEFCHQTFDIDGYFTP